MIVRILSRGKSFSGLASYLTHDPEAQTDERVGWTHTRNLANDHVPSAVDEMLWTARNAELLKQEAGIRAGGRATENTVKHLSLNWSPDDNPTREQMIETTEEFLRHMKWEEHQALLVAHEDKAYKHVHAMLNVVHPETGLRLDDNFERRRAQAWALDYEREQGRVYCEQRLLSPEDRENAPPRNMWMAFQENEKKFEREEKLLHQQKSIVIDDQKNRHNSEWKNLKEIQRTERISFFADGKSEFSELRNSIYREVRDEFRDRWADFYAAQKEGADPEALATLKAELVADQKDTLETRRNEACNELRESRNERYRELLDNQREVRGDLRVRQEAGLENADFLHVVGDRNAGKHITAGFGEAADQATTPQHSGGWQADTTAITALSEDEGASMNSGANVDADVGVRLGLSFGSFLDSLFFDLTTLGSAHASREPQPENPFAAAADDALKQQQQRERNEADEEWRERQRSPFGD